MSLALTQSLSAILPGLTSSFLATGGTPPYSYSVLPNGAGGSINSSTGLYTAPATMGLTPQTLTDTIRVTDSASNVAAAKVLVGSPMFLFCDIIQTVLNLPVGRVYLWDQKIPQPADSGLYVAVSVPVCKPFASTNYFDSNANSQRALNVIATIDLDIISRDAEARDRKEEVVMALLSQYSLQQQYANSFSIGRLPPASRFINLSAIDGSAIPYRYKISVNMTYSAAITVPVPYINTFTNPPTVYTNP